MTLNEHDGDFTIDLGRDTLMSSRQNESELELARIGCARLTERRNPRVLIGGLGLGYTLRQSLNLLGPGASVVVAEMMPQVVAWNRKYLGELNDHPLRDERVTVKNGDVLDVIRNAAQRFDSILLDVDNGPSAVTLQGNHRLYSCTGLRTCLGACTNRGCLAIWAARVEKAFERRVNRAHLHARYFRAANYKGAKSLSRCIWLVVRDRRLLPPLPKRERSSKT
jgi:spermidine synthase